MKNYIIFVDVETGGLHFDSPVIELAAIAVTAGTYEELDAIDIKIEFNTKDPHVSIEALGVSKFSAEAWKYAIPPADAAVKFGAFLRRHATVQRESKTGNAYHVAKLAGHNAQTFDAPLLENWFKKRSPRKSADQNPFYPALRLALDTLQLADWFFWSNPEVEPPPDLRLETLAAFFGLSQPDHSALNDVRATVELARVIAQYQRSGAMSQAA